MSVSPSACISSTQILLEEFPLNYIPATFIQLGRETQILGKIGSKYQTDLSRVYCYRRHKIAIEALLTAATCSTTMQEERVVVFPSLTVTYVCQQYKEEALLPPKLPHKYSTL